MATRSLDEDLRDPERRFGESGSLDDEAWFPGRWCPDAPWEGSRPAVHPVALQGRSR